MKLLFIHGAGGTKDKWREVVKQLGNISYETIDLPGHGDNEYNIITSIQDYASYIDQSIKEDTVVVGHSMGGLIALELAARNNKVKGVVLAASFYELPVHHSILETLASGEYPKSLFKASYYKEAKEALLDEELQALTHVPTEITYADFKACQNYKEGKDTLLNLQIPVCALLGKEDRLLPKNASEKLTVVKPDIKLVEVCNAGHYIMLEKPDIFLKELLAFVNEVQSQTV